MSLRLHFAAFARIHVDSVVGVDVVANVVDNHDCTELSSEYLPWLVSLMPLTYSISYFRLISHLILVFNYEDFSYETTFSSCLQLIYLDYILDHLCAISSR